MDYRNEFLDFTLATKSPSTHANYKERLGYVFPNEVNFSINYLIDKLKEWREKELSNNTILGRLTAYKELLNYSNKRSSIDNAKELVEICSNIKSESKEKEPLTKQQIEQIADHVRTKKNKVIVKTLATSGLRISELVQLNVEDYNGSAFHIKIEKGRRIKNYKEKIIPLPLSTCELLDDYIKEYGLYMGPLFIDKEGNRAKPNTIQAMIYRAGQVLGFKAHPHACRHYYVTQLLTKKHDAKTVMSLTGHKSYQSLMVYAHSNDKLKRDAVQSFDDS